MPRDRHFTDKTRRFISPISDCCSSDDNYCPSDYSGLKRGRKARSRSLSRSVSRSSSVSQSRDPRLSTLNYPREDSFYRNRQREYSGPNDYSNGLRYEKPLYYDTHSPSRSPSPVAHYPGLSHPRLEYWPDSDRCWSRDERPPTRTEPSRWEERPSDRSPTRYSNYRRNEESSPIERPRYSSQQPRSPARYRPRYRARGLSERRLSRQRAPWDSPPSTGRRRQSYSREPSRTRRFHHSPPPRRSPPRSPQWAVNTIQSKSYNSERLKPDSSLTTRKKDPEVFRNVSDKETPKKSKPSSVEALKKSTSAEASKKPYSTEISKKSSTDATKLSSDLTPNLSSDKPPQLSSDKVTQPFSEPVTRPSPTKNSKPSPPPSSSSLQVIVTAIDTPIKPVPELNGTPKEFGVPVPYNAMWPYATNSSGINSYADLSDSHHGIPPNMNDPNPSMISPGNPSANCQMYPAMMHYSGHDRSNTFPPLLHSGGYVPYLTPEQSSWPVPVPNQHVPFLSNIHSGLPQPGQYLPPFVPPLPPYSMSRPWVSHIPYRPARNPPVNPNLRYYNNPNPNGYPGHPYNIPSRHTASAPRPYHSAPSCSQPEPQKVDFKETKSYPRSAPNNDKVCRVNDSSSITPKDTVCSPVKTMDIKPILPPEPIVRQNRATSCSYISPPKPPPPNPTSKNPYSAPAAKPIEIQDSFPSLEPIQRLLDFNGDQLVSTSKPSYSVPPVTSRRPSHHIPHAPFISKPDFLVQYEEGLYPHPWPSKVDDEAAERKAELQRLRAAEAKIRFQLERSKFGLTLSQLEVTRLECSLSVSE